MNWFQKTLQLKPQNCGFLLIQAEIEYSLHELALFKMGIYLCEHRLSAGPRRLVATIWGELS